MTNILNSNHDEGLTAEEIAEIALLPRHGTRGRYRRYRCRCVACTKGTHGMPIPDELRWPLGWLVDAVGMDRLTGWFTDEEIVRWKADGLADFEADKVCTTIGEHPTHIWPGYDTAGLDCHIYP